MSDDTKFRIALAVLAFATALMVLAWVLLAVGRGWL